jgi:hypothetical protein
MFPSTFPPALAVSEDSPRARPFDNRVFENSAAAFDVAGFGDSSDPLAQQLARDPAFQALKVLRRSHDGELRIETLARAGVASISLDHFEDSRALGPNARVARTGSLTRTDGTLGEAADVLFDYRRG